MLLLIFKFVFYYWLVDVFSGIYHYLTDKGYNIRRQVLEFRNHHDHPEGFNFDWYPVAGCIPFLLLGFLHTDFLIFGMWIAFLQIPHLAAHKNYQGKIVKFLQKTGVFVTPEQHNGHHNGVFDKNYCIVTSWNNWWFNEVVKLFPLKERVVQ